VLNFLVSLARTGIPSVWGALVSWLAARGLGDDVLATVNDPAWSGALVVGAVGVITTAVYALVRVIELNLPRVLSRFLPADVVEGVNRFVVVLLLGVPRSPDYRPGETGTR
jgi:hypothetical protein